MGDRRLQWGWLVAILGVSCDDSTSGADPTVDAQVGPDAADRGAPGRGLPEQLPLRPTEADFGFNPALGIVTSHRFLLVTLTPEAKGAELAGLLAETGCVLGGTAPQLAMAQLDCGPDPGFTLINETAERLRASGIIETLTLDVLLSPTVVPPPPPANGPEGLADWAWTTVDDLPGTDANWGLLAIGAPQAWHLNHHIRKREAESPSPVWPIPVLVFDVENRPHPDLPGFGGSMPGPGTSHGTAVAGIIGAQWGNARFTDGVTPFAQVAGLQASFHGLADKQLAWSAVILDLDAHFVSASPRPRLVNISLGFNWALTCKAWPASLLASKRAQCNPAAPGPSPTNTCNGADIVTQVIEPTGQQMALLVRSLNSPPADPVFFVSAAGNDSRPPGMDPCAPGAFGGLGPLPAELGSPFNWAALREAGTAEHMIVAEALDVSVQRADYSNIGGHVFAPADGNAAPDVINGQPGVTLFSGTSAAAPFVTGTAAYLLAIEPTLTNAELKILLTDVPCTDAQAGGGSPTNRRIHLYKAALCIDRLRPDRRPSVLTWLADMDDGSPDGFLRVIKPDVPGAQPVVNPDEDRRGDGQVDLKDFRRLRDQYAMLQASLSRQGDPYLDTAPPNPRLDLNEDGRVNPGPPEALLDFEDHFRANLSLSNQVLFDPQGDLTASEVFEKAYEAANPEGDPLQGWPAESLPDLRASSFDLHLRLHAREVPRRVDDAIDLFGASAFSIKIESMEPPPEGLDLSPLDWVQIPRATDEVVLTSPLRVYPTVRVQPICGEVIRPDLEFTAQVGVHARHAEDVVLWLNRQHIPQCHRACDGTIINNAPPCEDPVVNPPPDDPPPGDPPGAQLSFVHLRETCDGRNPCNLLIQTKISHGLTTRYSRETGPGVGLYCFWADEIHECLEVDGNGNESEWVCDGFGCVIYPSDGSDPRAVGRPPVPRLPEPHCGGGGWNHRENRRELAEPFIVCDGTLHQWNGLDGAHFREQCNITSGPAQESPCAHCPGGCQCTGEDELVLECVEP